MVPVFFICLFSQIDVTLNSIYKKPYALIFSPILEHLVGLAKKRNKQELGTLFFEIK